MEFGKRHDTTDTMRQLVTDVLRGNWCNGFWPLDCSALRLFAYLLIHSAS